MAHQNNSGLRAPDRPGDSKHFAEESRARVFRGNLAGGGRVVFLHVQGNHALSTYIFDTAGHQAYFGGGT